MAITLEDSQIGTGDGGSGNITLTFGTAPIEDDLVLLVGGHAQQSGPTGGNIGPVTTGYTTIQTGDDADTQWGAWYKIMDGSPDTDVECIDGGSFNGMVYATYVLQGVDTTTPMDETAVMSTWANGAVDPDAIVTATANAWVVAVASVARLNRTFTNPPSGYSGFQQAQRVDTNRFVLGMAYVDAGAAGSEDPGAFTLSSSIFRDWEQTIAIRPAGAAANTQRYTFTVTGVG